MKQQITMLQRNSLSEKASKKYNEWMCRNYEPMKIGFMNIGDMIEFLDPKTTNCYDGGFIDFGEGWSVYCEKNAQYYNSEELCDALWQAVVEVLEKI